jgi:hypothetical protein
LRKRLPPTGTYNTRFTGTGATTASGIVGLGVVGALVVGATGFASEKDCRFINCLPLSYLDKIAGQKWVKIVKRPGFAAVNTPDTGELGKAIHVWVGQASGTKVISAFGSTSELFDGTTSLGSITGECIHIDETSISGTATLTFSSSNGKQYYYQNAGSITEITDGDAPMNASRTIAGYAAHMDGYMFLLDTTGRLYNSDVNSVVNWTALSFITANSQPDVGVCVVRHRNTLITFFKQHYEVFRNAGIATGSPLEKMEHLAQSIGCVNHSAITTVGDVVFWMGVNKDSVISLYSYDAGRVDAVSDPQMDALWGVAGPSNISLTTIGYHGRSFVVVNVSNRSYAYCVEEKHWHELGGSRLWYKAAGVTTGTTTSCYAVSDKVASGKVYAMSPSAIVWQDDGAAVSSFWVTPRWDNGHSGRKRMGALYVVADQSLSSAELGIRFYDDDYQNASTRRTVDLADLRPRLHRCGSFFRRAFAFDHNANSEFRIEAIEVDVEE